MLTLALAILGLTVLTGTAAIYLHFHQWPTTVEKFDWSSFGSFMGGVAGPLLSLLALLAVAGTLLLQARSLAMERKKQSAEEHLRWIEGIRQDIIETLDAPLRMNARAATTLRTILEGGGALPSSVDENHFNLRIREFTKLLGGYCEAVAIYRANITAVFETRILVDRGARWLDQLKPFQSSVSGHISIEFCDIHLRGEGARRQPEAMKRPTRL
jgi:hypothetical protein